MQTIYEIILLNQTKAYLVSEVDEARAFAFAQSCGLGEIVDFRSIGPVLANIYDKAVVPSVKYAEIVTLCRD